MTSSKVWEFDSPEEKKEFINNLRLVRVAGQQAAGLKRVLAVTEAAFEAVKKEIDVQFPGDTIKGSDVQFYKDADKIRAGLKSLCTKTLRELLLMNAGIHGCKMPYEPEIIDPFMALEIRAMRAVLARTIKAHKLYSAENEQSIRTVARQIGSDLVGQFIMADDEDLKVFRHLVVFDELLTSGKVSPSFILKDDVIETVVTSDALTDEMLTFFPDRWPPAKTEINSGASAVAAAIAAAEAAAAAAKGTVGDSSAGIPDASRMETATESHDQAKPMETDHVQYID